MPTAKPKKNSFFPGGENKNIQQWFQKINIRIIIDKMKTSERKKERRKNYL
jgi:hypothetical protein